MVRRKKQKQRYSRIFQGKNFYWIAAITALTLIFESWPFHEKTDREYEINHEITEDRCYVEPRFSCIQNTKEIILRRLAYTTSYNLKTRTPNWVGWVLTADHTDGEYARSNHSFAEDTDVPQPRAIYSDIREVECGYQRGHMCPAGDNKWSYKAQQESFLMTNICPQDGYLNQYDWKYLEEACREWAKEYGNVCIVAGPVFLKKPYRTVGEHKVAVPDAFFKVIMVPDAINPKAIGFLYENIPGHHKMEYYAKSVDEIEDIVKLDFFYQLDDEIENRIESECDLSKWRTRFDD